MKNHIHVIEHELRPYLGTDQNFDHPVHET